MFTQEPMYTARSRRSSYFSIADDYLDDLRASSPFSVRSFNTSPYHHETSRDDYLSSSYKSGYSHDRTSDYIYNRTSDVNFVEAETLDATTRTSKYVQDTATISPEPLVDTASVGTPVVDTDSVEPLAVDAVSVDPPMVDASNVDAPVLDTVAHDSETQEQCNE
ncbi:hypothetical protein ACF0H5_000771 [Mactra antiquata]